MPVAFIPSPARALWHLGPVPLRAQALCAVAGILVALAVTGWRYRRAGGRAGVIAEVAAWAVPAGLIPALAGVLLAHVHPDVLQVVRTWDEVAGFPAAVACGLAGAWLGCRRMRVPGAGGAPRDRGQPGAQSPLVEQVRPAPVLRRNRVARVGLAPIAGAAAPALLFGHAVTMIGLWFAQRGYGKPSALWWAVTIAPAHRAQGLENFATFQPIFVYRALCDLALGIAITWAASRFELSGDRVLALAAGAYAAAGFALTWLGIGHSPGILGLRAAALGNAVLLIAAVTYFIRTKRRRSVPSHLTGKVAIERSRPFM